MASVINDNFIPLCVDMLASQAPADVKEECIDCLCDILAGPNSEDIALTQELIEAISKIEASHERSFMDSSNSILACRILMLKIITETANKEEMIEWGFEFSGKDRSTKLALAECVEQYLRHYVDDPAKTDAMILSIILQCYEDDYWPVRRMACNCLAQMLNTRYKDRIERKLYEGAIDPSPYVRNHLLRMCKNKEIADVTVSERIIEIMRNDANYAIRVFASDSV